MNNAIRRKHRRAWVFWVLLKFLIELENKTKQYSVTEYAAFKGISRAAVQKQINTGKIKAKKIGATWIVYVIDG